MYAKLGIPAVRKDPRLKGHRLTESTDAHEKYLKGASQEYIDAYVDWVRRSFVTSGLLTNSMDSGVSEILCPKSEEQIQGHRQKILGVSGAFLVFRVLLHGLPQSAPLPRNTGHSVSSPPLLY